MKKHHWTANFGLLLRHSAGGWALLALLLAISSFSPTAAQTSATFYRAINLGGPAVSIDGRTWEANTGTTPNFSTNGSTQCNQWLTLNPAATTEQAAMLTCWREHWEHNIVLSSVPNAQYQVFVYAIQSWNDTSNPTYTLTLEGAQAASYQPGTSGGRWARLGPYTVNVTDGTLNIGTRGAVAVLAGVEVWTAGAIPLPTATPIPPTAAPLPTLPPGQAGGGGSATAGIPQNIQQGLLRGGVNLQFNFYDIDTYNPRAFDAELPLIAAAGAGHVRIPISMDIIESGTTGNLRADRAADIVGFVQRAQANGLVTIVDIHNTGQKLPNGTWNEDYMGGLRNASMRTRHIRLLSQLATYLGTNANTDWFVLQPANEPIFGSDPQVWYNHQVQLLPAMRVACANCVIFAMAHDWQGADATVWNIDPSRAPYNDRKLIFDVHFYEPINFTHCEYPGQANNCPGMTWPGTYTTWRGTQNWNRALIDQLLRPLFEWKTRHGVFVHFSEIGTTAALAETPRAAYLSDLVGILRANGAGYSLYEWHRNFGIKQHPAVVRAVFSGTPVTPPPTTAPATPTPLPPTATPAPQSATLNVIVTLAGRSAANTSFLVMYSGITQTVNTDANGSFQLTNVPPSTSAIYIKHPQSLSSVISVTLVSGNSSVTVGPLQLGDVNNDNQISLLDFSMMAGSFNRSNGQAGFVGNADLNADGTVSLIDFSMMAEGFSMQGAPPP